MVGQVLAGEHLGETDDQAARQRADSKRFNGFFAGVPSLIKDNLDLRGLPTGHGSRALGQAPLKKTSGIAKQYLAQGFNLLGKSTLPALSLIHI